MLKTKLKPKARASSLKRVRPRRGQFYKGVEWLACWLLDNAEGETITEEQLRPWAAAAWSEYLQAQRRAEETS